jgi:hypothetical protein
LVVEGTIIFIVPLIAPLLLNALSLLAPVFDPAACISAMDDVAQVSVIPNMPSAVLLRWSKADGQVLALTLLMVKLLTLISIILVVNRVHHD